MPSTRGFTPQPMLAESCTVSGTTCTITLRGGVTFSDGSAVTASDVVRSLQRRRLRALRRAPCRREPHRRGQRRHGCAHACL